MGDILWDIATSVWTLAIASGLGVTGLIVCLFVFGPVVVGGVLKRLVGAIVGCTPCMVVLAIAAAAYGGLLYGSNIEAAKCEARIELRLKEQREEAADAARDRDAGVKVDLEKNFKPKIAALEQRAKDLQGEVAKYAKRKPVGKAGTSCKLGDAAGLLQPRQPR
jgi:hypothetical protein